MSDTPTYPTHGPRQTADLIEGFWIVRDMTDAEAAIAFPPPPPPPALTLEQERAAMRCRAASMRRILHRTGLLATVQGIADGDPEASIVFEYEPYFHREDSFIVELGGPNGFTPEQIDDLFRAAMALET